MSAGPFARRRGSFEMRLGEGEVEILVRVAGEMRAQVSMPDRPPHLYRLFPTVYADDDEAQSEFARFTTDDLIQQKLRALDDVERIVSRGQVKRGTWSAAIEDGEETSLLVTLNDARLALGTRLAVTEEMEDEPVDESDAEAFAHAVYRWLGWLQSHLIDELML